MKQRLIFLVALIAWCGTLAVNAAETGDAGPLGILLVANKGDQTLGLIDPVAGRMIAIVPEDGVTGHEVVASPDGRRAFVVIFGNAGVGKSGTDGRTVGARNRSGETPDCRHGGFGQRHAPALRRHRPEERIALRHHQLENSVTVIDPRTLQVVATIPTGQPESHMLAITRDGRCGFTSNVGPGTVSILDLEAKKVLAIIPVSKTAQRIALSVDDRWVFTADPTKPQLAVIDAQTNGIRTWIELPGPGYGTAPTLDGRWLIVALISVNKLVVIDLTTMKVAHTLDVPRAPQEVLVRPDGAEACVSCDASRQIAVIDVKNWKVKQLIDAGPGDDGLAWAVTK